jgi:hypothetical protein
MGWKKWPSWLKGGIIFSVLMLLFVLYVRSITPQESCLILEAWPGPSPPSPLWCDWIFGNLMPLLIIAGFIFGVLIGVIVSKVKKQ